MGATGGAGTAHHSGAPAFTPGFQWGSCYSIFSFFMEEQTTQWPKEKVQKDEQNIQKN
jgi:hypothetical protein